MRLLKKIIMLLIMFTCFFTTLQAKDIEGYYIPFGSEEKITVVLVIPFSLLIDGPDYSRMWDKIRYMSSDSRAKLLPDSVREVHFVYNNKEIIMRSFFDDLNLRRQIFMHLLIEGPMCLYDYYVDVEGYRNIKIAEKVLKRKDGPLEPGNKKNIIELLSDCPLIADQVKSGALKGLEIIVAKYNAECSH